jgi:hypothetical protein
LTNTQVLLTFDQAVAGGATTIAFYRLVVPGNDPTQDIGELRILGASLSADGFTVTLTTSPQKDLQYEVIVTNVVGKSGNVHRSDAQHRHVLRHAPVDTTRRLLSAARQVASCICLSRTDVARYAGSDQLAITPPLVTPTRN